MRYNTLAVLGTAVLALTACGGSSGNGTASTSSTPPPGSPASQIFVAGVVESDPAGLRLNRLPLDSKGARFTLNGQPADPALLKAGMPIMGTAQMQSGALKLDNLEAHSEIEGPLESADHGLLRVLGRPFAITQRTRIVDDRVSNSEVSLRLENLTIQSNLRIFGVKGSGSAIEATRVELRQDRQGEVELWGTVQGLNPAASTFTLSGTPVEFSHAEVVGNLVDGATVEVRGVLSGTVVAAARVKVEEKQVEPKQAEAELRGAISELDTSAKTFSLLGLIIDFSGATLEGQLQDGVWVEVHAFQAPGQPAGHLSATRVEVEDSMEDEGSENEAEGLIANFDAAAMQFTLGGLTIKADAMTVYEKKGDLVLTAAEFWGTDRNGAKAEVKGTLTGSILDAKRIELK